MKKLIKFMLLIVALSIHSVVFAEDPPTIPLTPDKVDYLNKKFKNKIATFFVNVGAKRFIKNLVKNGQMIIKDIKGI